MTRFSALMMAAVFAILPTMSSVACEEHAKQAAPKRISQMMDGTNQTFICNLTDLRKNVKMTYAFENPLANMLAETSVTRDGTTISHNPKARPIWGSDTKFTYDGRIYFVATYLKDPVYKLVVNDRPSTYDEVEGFPESRAQIIKENYGPVSEGTCHVVLQ